MPRVDPTVTRRDRRNSRLRFMRGRASWIAAAGLILVACSSQTGSGVRPTASTTAPATTTLETTTSSSQHPRLSTGFGVIIPGGHGDSSDIVNDLGAKWVRINVNLGRSQPDPRWYLDKDINVILTISNRDGNNADPTYGTPAQWPQAGFPYLSADRYSSELRSVITPLVPAVSAGRQVWVQCENEVFDASIVSQSRYWRGTTAQYLTLEKTCYDTTKSVDPAMRVVLSSFSSEGLAEAAAGSGPGAREHETFYEKLLSDASYDAVDLHFYGCVSDIPSKVRWVNKHRPQNTQWISTENGGPDPRCPPTPQTWQQDLSTFEQTEAAQVPERLTACADNGGAVCLWFSLFDLRGQGVIFSHLGLLDGSTSPPREKPAYHAFRTFVAQRGGQVTGPSRAEGGRSAMPDLANS